MDVLRAYGKPWGDRMKGFPLQRRISGVEAAVCGLSDGERFVEPVSVNFAHYFRDLLPNFDASTATQTQATAA